VIAPQHIHPMLVHFPIVFVFVLAAFDLAATVRGYSVTGRNSVGNVSTGLAIMAAASAVAAYFFGDMALSIAEDKGFSSQVAEIHEGLGMSVAAVLSAWAVIRAALWFFDARIRGIAAAIFPLAAAGAASLVATTAYYGGQLVFDLGVNVAKAATLN